MEEQANKPDASFGVDIRSGRRAVATDVPKREPRGKEQERPTSASSGKAAEKKARNRNLTLGIVGLVVIFFAALVGWQWFSTRVPAWAASPAPLLFGS